MADALSKKSYDELAHLTILLLYILSLFCAIYALADHCVALIALGSDEFKDTDIDLSA